MLSAEITGLLNQTTTCAVCDVLMRRGSKPFMRSRIRLLSGPRLAGPALTIERKALAFASRQQPRPNSLFIETIETAPAGTVVVLNGDPEHEAALWGGLLAAAAVRRGLGGVLADGPIRDLPEIIEMKLPLFGTGSIPPGQAGILTLGAINEPLVCGDIVVHPGDFVYGDANGVVVIPAGLEVEVLREAVAVEARDQEATKRILAGASLQETMKALGRG